MVPASLLAPRKNSRSLRNSPVALTRWNSSELAAAADEAGFQRTVFYSNFHFDNLAGKDLANRRGNCSFLRYLDSFLDMHHGVSADGLAKLRTHLFPMFGRLEELFSGGDGAPLLGCMVFCR